MLQSVLLYNRAGANPDNALFLYSMIVTSVLKDWCAIEDSITCMEDADPLQPLSPQLLLNQLPKVLVILAFLGWIIETNSLSCHATQRKNNVYFM